MHLRHVRKTMSLAAMLAFGFTLAAHAQSAGAGAATFQHTCSVCHSTTRATSLRLSRSGWESTVDNMVARGAQATPAQQEQIVNYLTANYGLNTPAPKNTATGKSPNPPEKKAPTVPVLNSSQIARAKELIQSNGCLACHVMDGKGSYLGPSLGNVGAMYSAQQILAALVSPNKELTPQNRLVRIATHDGKTVTGRLLNQDAFSVQVIDASGQLLSFEKANLPKFTIISANPMPSYANRLTPESLSLLVKYLETRTDASTQ